MFLLLMFLLLWWFLVLLFLNRFLTLFDRLDIRREWLANAFATLGQDLVSEQFGFPILLFLFLLTTSSVDD